MKYSSFAHTVDDPTHAVEFVGGIFPRNHVSILASKAGIGKTWYIVKLLSDLSVGGTIFLTQAYNHPPTKSLYFVGETDPDLVINRFKLLKGDRDSTNITIIPYIGLARKGLLLDLDTKDGANLCMDIVTEFRPDIVLFDSLMSFRNTDESDAATTKDMMLRLKIMAETTGAAIVATHHVRKRDRRTPTDRIDQDEIIGSSALVRMASTAFILQREFDTLTLHCVKSWWKYPPPLSYRMVDDDGIEFQVSYVMNDETEKRLRAETFCREQFNIDNTQLTVKGVMMYCNVSATTARNALNNTGKIVGRVPGSPSEFLYGSPTTTP